MPRISSEKTRQAILVKDPVFDESVIPERIALFDEDHQMVSVNLVNRGPWISTSAYAENEIVTYDGGSYLAKQPIAANPAGNDTPDVDLDTWTNLAQKGAPGIIGLTWQDEWDSLKTYVYRDAVTYAGASWMARYENINIVPGTLAEDVRAPDGTTPASVLIPSDADHVKQTPPNEITSGVYWWRFDVETEGDFTFTVDPTVDPYIGVTNALGVLVGIAEHIPTITRHLTPGRYYFRCQQYSSLHSSDWEATVTPADKLTEPLGDAWLLLAERGIDGEDGPQGIQGPTGPPGPIAHWRGEFNGASGYARGDSVSYNGEMWWATDDMAAGAAPVPSVEVVVNQIGDNPGLGGTQHVYELPLGVEVEFPLASPDTAFSVSGSQVNWFRVHAEPTSTLTIHPGIGGRFTAYRADGTYANRYSGLENVTGDKTLVMPAEGYIWIEWSDGGLGGSPVMMVEGTPNESFAVPTWARVASKGADGADGEIGPEGPEGPEGPQGPAGVGSGGVGVPVGGTDGQLLTKTSAVDYEMAWEDPAEPPPSGLVPATLASLAEIGPTAAGNVNVGPAFTFEVGPSGMVLVHFSCEFKQPPGSAAPHMLIDGTDMFPVAGSVGNTTYQRYDLWVGSFWTPGAFAQTVHKAGIPGVMLFLAEGEHTMQFCVRNNASGGGYAQKLRYAALPL